MATTTRAAIRDQMISDIEALTPTSAPSDIRFRRSPRKTPLRKWATESNQSSAVLRRFEILWDGLVERLPYQETTAYERRDRVTVTVAYPVKVGQYGSDELDDLQDTVELDIRQIRDKIETAASYVSGENLATVVSEEMDRSDDNVWFADLGVEITYYAAQTV